MADFCQTQYIEITIAGHLSDQRIRDFEGLLVTYLPDGETLISGEIKDQSELFGLLIRIRDMGIPLLSLECKPSEIIQPLGGSS